MKGLALWVGVGCLGGCGALARMLLDGFVSSRTRGAFPLGTLAVNLSGALVLGVLAGAAVRGDALLLTGTAVIGAYTTFSTWMFETHRLAEDGGRLFAVVNVVASIAAGVAAAALGRAIGGG